VEDNFRRRYGPQRTVIPEKEETEEEEEEEEEEEFLQYPNF
jgi:hypothetical protein